jgi:hypothetical protein
MSRLSEDVIEHWPEVLKDIDVHTIPIEYLHSINVEFDDGRVWHVDVDPKTEMEIRAVEDSVEELLTEYEDYITKIDFSVNINKVKHDMQKRTNKFMKKRI